MFARKCAPSAVEPATWDLTVTTTAEDQIYIVNIAAGTGIDIDIDWGDGGAVTNHTTTGQKSKTYASAGTYTVKISGSFSGNDGNIRCGTDTTNRPYLKATGVVGGVTGLVNFNATFLGCTGLTSLPTDLFRYNTAVSTSGFRYAFYGCTGLTSLPALLFKYNTDCTSCANVFEDCNKLQLRADIFFDTGEEGTRFLNQTVTFDSAMSIGTFTGTQGTAPALWTCSFGTGTPTKTSCFTGHTTSSIDNHAAVVADGTWGLS